jgi:hypothetical protein
MAKFWLCPLDLRGTIISMVFETRLLFSSKVAAGVTEVEEEESLEGFLFFRLVLGSITLD